MDATLELTHERVDDVPLLLGFLRQLRLPEILDRHLPQHPLHQGLSNGDLIAVWIAYILSRADHRKSPIQAWTQKLQLTLETLLGQTIRPAEFSDDRLTLVLKRLADTPAWEAIEADLWHAHCDVYALPVDRVRLDATTSCGYHTITDDGLMQLGHSKDHRVRCSIHPLIPFAERSPLGQRGWVIRLTHDRKVRGTKARRRSEDGEKLVKPSPARPAWYGQG